MKNREAKGMKAIKLIGVVCISLALLTGVTATTARAEAECCYYFNPLFLPFAVAGAVVGTAAAIVTGVVPGPPYAYPADYRPAYYAPAPAYYGPGPYHPRPVWISGHYNRHGAWVPGHWRRLGWIPGHYDRYGTWIAGHWG